MRELLASAADLLRNIASLDRIMKLPRLERSNADLQGKERAGLGALTWCAPTLPAHYWRCSRAPCATGRWASRLMMMFTV